MVIFVRDGPVRCRIMLNEVIQRELIWFYPWLRRMTNALMALESRVHTLQPTALAHEVFAKLLAWQGEVTGNTEHSLRMLSLTIAKQTLIDHGRRRSTRGKHWDQVRDLHRSRLESEQRPSVRKRLTAMLDAIEEMDSLDPVLANLVRLRFFEGNNLRQSAQMLGLSQRTAARRWAFAKAFLADAISRSES